MSVTVQGSFPRTARLLSGADFNHVFKGKNKRFGNRYWTILVVSQSPQTIEAGHGARLGMAIAKKRARRAVDRNRLKRQVRETFRGKRSQLGNIDVVVMNRDSAATATSDELSQSFSMLLGQIKKDRSLTH